MFKLQTVTAAAAILLLTGCATSISTPNSVQPLPMAQTAPVQISNVTADADPGVLMGDNDYSDIISLVRSDLAANPQLVLAQGVAGDTVRLHFTRFDRGNAFARFMLAGLGQIHIDATVFVTSASGQQLGEYTVSKAFFLGGVYGGTTTVGDVEVGFAKSVAAIFQPGNA